jgi:isoleucyl-tRNA synthetase
MSEDKNTKVSYKNTLNLPTTEFPIRANPKAEDPIMLERWQQEDLYRKSFFAHKEHAKFILHDGPPYANGNIHLGHAFNKILKDIVGKSQRMFGNQVPITPGWDCHGLPIELKVTQENPGLDRVALKKACRVYAQKWIDAQRSDFKKLGVLMDWDKPYTTMDFTYEASVLRAFGEFVSQGYIERSNKTVPWCPSCQTVLASAEIEYEDRKDPSVYVYFTLTQEALKTIVPELSDKEVHLLVWTTTPWTLPLNRAVLLKPSTEYVVQDLDGHYIITARQLAEKVAALKKLPSKIVATFNTSDIISGAFKAHHPFVENFQVPIILDNSVLLEDGTAVVHSAPGCGPEDYQVGIKNNLEIFSPITPDGKYTPDIKPQELAGMAVADGQWWVLRKLDELGKLFYKANIVHSYPHCWRCHGGLIFRATKQWFCDLSQHDLKQRSLDAVDQHMCAIPEKSINRLKATLEGRLEWCLSRQRIWGVPIPAIIHDKSDFVYISKELIDTVADHVAHEGIEWWDTVSIQDLLPADFDFVKYPLHELRKEQDILDVWFESGVSYYAVLLQNKELGFPADLYLEGKDQHRAWFQSSLLCSMVTNDIPPMKTVLTHGFTVDEKGRKMSKSIGNVVVPDQMIDELGTDGLRLWVSSIDASGEAVVSKVLITNVKEVYRKIRNTCRFLISNLYDFDISKDAVPTDQLQEIDAYGLQELYKLQHKVLRLYTDMDFTGIFHLFGEYVSADLSSFYLDIIKDRLYVEKADGHKRRSAQTACWYILDTLTRLMAPILSFTAEQLSDCYQKNKTESIHLQRFASLDALRSLCNMTDLAAQENNQLWATLRAMRSAMLKAIEQLREKGLIKHSLEAQVQFFVDPSSAAAQQLNVLNRRIGAKGQLTEEFFQEFLIVSQIHIFDEKQSDMQTTQVDGLYVYVTQADGVKCPRCWQWQVTESVDQLCGRCFLICD